MAWTNNPHNRCVVDINDRVARIVDLTFSQIKILYQNDLCTEWIDKNSDRINTDDKKKIFYVSLQEDIRHSDFSGDIRDPILWENATKKCFLYSNSNGVYSYDILSKTHSLLSKYPFTLTMKHHNSILDPTNNLLYLFGGNKCSFATLDLNNKQWDIMVTHSIDSMRTAKKYNTFALQSFLEYGPQINAVFVPTPINEIHLVKNDMHMKFDKIKKVFVNSGKLPHNDREYKMIYAKIMGKLFIFGTENHKIFYCDFTHNNQNKYEWKEFALSMPITTGNTVFIVTLISDNVVMIYYTGKVNAPFCWNNDSCHDIYFMDLKYQMLFKSHKHSSKHSGEYLIKCDDMIHNIGGTHQKWYLNDVLPNELEIFYRENVYDALVFGYVKELQNEEKLFSIVPFYISKIIVSYYPSQFDCQR